MRIAGYILAVYLTLTTSIAQADLLTLDTIDQGRFRADGKSNLARIGIIGWLKDEGHLLRAFFVFDLSDFSGLIESATFNLPLEAFGGAALPATIDLFDFTTQPTLTTAITPAGDPMATAFYEDLGSGTYYGSTTFPRTLGTVASIELNEDAIADLNDAIGGHFVVGLSMRNPTTHPGLDDYLRFGNGRVAGNQLELNYSPLATEPDPGTGDGVATPEPAAVVIWLLLIVPACVWGVRKRRSLAS